MFATMPFHLTQNTNCKTLDVDSWQHRTSYGMTSMPRKQTLFVTIVRCIASPKSRS